ncbi:MAG: hypothetical protein JXQ76_08830 [Campylobacterales bacterium]|nr:hypothetical protein [Campylobacterales bacterium]
MTITQKSIEIPLTRELQEFVISKYSNQTSKLIDDFLIYLNTKKEAQEINQALKEVKQNKTNPVNKLLNEL